METNVSSANSNFSFLIDLQFAEGYWNLDDSLASIVGQSLSVLKSLCPKGVSEVVWGTILALALLEIKHNCRRDEWELLSRKSEKWLNGQSLPRCASVASLTKFAKQCLA